MKLLLLFLLACVTVGLGILAYSHFDKVESKGLSVFEDSAESGEGTADDPVESLLDTTLADGFDFPIGDRNGKGSYTSAVDGKTYDGWYIATSCGEKYSLGIHTGEDWNGTGGGNTDLGQPVYATASGEVVFAGECPSPWGNVVMIRHRYFDNGKIRSVYSQYSHLKEIHVQKGKRVAKRQPIGSIGQGNRKEFPAHLHFEIRSSKLKDYPVDYWPSSHGKSVQWVKQHYADPSAFIRKHRMLSVPGKESLAIITVKHRLKSYLYKQGALKRTYEVALSQVPKGHKQQEGDLKLPEGAYYICEKTKGPFASYNDWAQAYLGTRWMQISYPNTHDAEAGLKKGLITQSQYEKIRKAFEEREMPLENTKLGGGIGIHGWVESGWSNDDTERALTWGCISMHKKDLEELYDIAALSTMVIVLP